MTIPGQLEPGSRVRFIAVIIPAGQSLSQPVDLQGWMIKGVWMPGEFDGTSLTFQAAPTLAPGTALGLLSTFPYQNVYGSGGAEWTVTVAQGQYCTLISGGEQAASIRYVKVRAGTSGTPAVQTSSRTLYLACAMSTK